MLEVSTM